MKISPVELSLLASISNGFTGGQIVETIESLVASRSMRDVCSSKEFLPILGLKTPVFVDEENLLKVRIRVFSFLGRTIFLAAELVQENAAWPPSSDGKQSNVVDVA